MKFFVEDEVVRLDLDTDHWVDIKKRMSYGDQQLLMSYFVQIQQGEKDLEVKNLDIARGNIALLEINIKAWNLPGKDGNAMPVNKASINMLDPMVAEKILAEIGKRNPSPKV